jgi:hypothetical protein
MDEQPRQELAKRHRKRAEETCLIAEDIRSNVVEQSRTDALVTARALALAGLPRKRTDSRYVRRTLRLGKDLWLRVTYAVATPDGILPYGADRFVLAGIQHLALQRHSPVVYFEQVSELLKLFDISTDGNSLRRLRDRFNRIRKLTITLEFAETESGLKDASVGQGIWMIKDFVLPTRKQLRDQLRAMPLRQLRLPGLEPSAAPSPYGVLLSADFWEHLKQPENHLILRLDILKKFITRPVGWDYATFLGFRCSRAETWSPVPHEALMSLFKDSPKESDNNAIKRLLGYHDEIMQATAGQLKAEWRQAGHIKTGKRGRPKERWELWVGRSGPITWSGRKDRLLPAPESET